MTLSMPQVVHEFSPGTVAGVPVYTDLTNRWHTRCSIRRGKQYERGQAQAGTMTTTYRNNDGYLSPSNTSSPYYPGVVLYAPLRVRAQYPRTANLLSGDLATAGEVSPLAPGAVPSSLNVMSDFGIVSIANSASAWHGSQVFATAMPANASLNFSPFNVNYLPVQALSAAAPATTYAWSGWVRSATTGANPQITAWIRFFTAAGGVVSTPAGTAVTLTGNPNGGWARVQVSASVPSGAVYAELLFALTGASPTAAWAFQCDGLQFEIGSSASTWTQPGIWYYLYQGFVERWPQSWKGDGVKDSSGNYSVVRPTVTDSLSLMGRQKLNYCYLEYLLPMGPRWLFQLNEASNGYVPVTGNAFGTISMAWADTMAYLNPIYAYSLDWKYASVTPGSSPVSVNPAGAFAGTPGPVLQSTSGTDGTVLYSAQLSIDGTNAGHIGPPQGGTGWSVVVAFLAQQQPGYPTKQYTDPYMWCAAQSLTYESQAFAGLAITTGGQVQARIGNLTNNYVNSSAASTYMDGNWHLACMTVSAAGTTLTLMVDGATPVTQTTANFASGQTYTYESIGAYPGPNAGWCGYLALVTEFGFPLASSQFSTLYTAWRSAFGGESSGARLGRILTVAGLTFPTSIQAGATAMGPAGDWSSAAAALPFQGQSVLSLAQSCVDAEQGQMYAAANGTFTFTGRLYRSPAPSTGLLPVFGENADGWLLGDAVRSVLGSTTVPQSEIPYVQAEVGYDADQAYTIAQVTASDGLPPVAGTTAQTLTVENATAVAGPLGVQLYSQNLNINSISGTQQVAQWVVDNGSTQDERVTSLVVKPAALSPVQQASAWPTLLGLDINRCVAVKRRPLGGTALSLAQWLENVQILLEPERSDWTFTYQMSPVSKSLG